MADLYSLAKANDYGKFEAEWASKLGKTIPLNSDDAKDCRANYDYYRSIGGGSGTPPPTSKTMSLETILESKKGQSKIADIGAQDSIDALKFMDVRIDPITKFKMIQSEILNQLKRESDLRTNIAETMGLSGGLLDNYVERLAVSQINALRFGYTMEQVAGMVNAMSDTTGKFNLLTEETLNRSYETGRAFVGNLRDLGNAFTKFEEVGLGASNAMDSIDKAGRSSLSLGLNSKKTTQLLINDLNKLNEFGFSRGVDGLNRMVQKSLEFKMNMGEVFKFADKVMDPDKAIELTANMQMLGGAVGDLNDPLKLMYMATNNVEGLQDALIGAAGNLATYNKEQGRFEITGINLRRAKEMANQLGISYQELAKSAVASQERMAGLNDLMGKGFDLKDEDREFIVNMAQMKDGKMTITIPQDVADKIGTSTSVALQDLDKTQIETLTGLREELREKSVEEIAREQFTTIKNMENDLKSLTQRSIRQAGRKLLGEGTKVDQSFKNVFGESLETLGRRQAAGGSTGFDAILAPTINKLDTYINDKLKLDDRINKMFKSLGDVLKGNANETPEDIKDKKRRENLEKESKPIAINLKHDFNLIPRFDAPVNFDYKGTKEYYV